MANWRERNTDIPSATESLRYCIILVNQHACLQVLLKLKLNFEGPLLELRESLQNLLFDPFDAFVRSLFRRPTRKSKGRKKYDWEKEFQFIVRQFDEGEVAHLDDQTYDPIF